MKCSVFITLPTNFVYLEKAPLGYTAKVTQPVQPVENGIEQCFAANIVQYCQQYCSALLHLITG